MSKPETSKGAQIVDLMGALRASLGLRQDAPKAEAPPAPKCVCGDEYMIGACEVHDKPAPPAPKRGYWLRLAGMEWQAVTKAAFVAAERANGFRSKFGPTKVATSSFSGGGIEGRTFWTSDMAPAPPANVSEPRQPKSEPPKWMEEARDMAFEELNRAYLALLAERDALKAEVAAAHKQRAEEVMEHVRQNRILKAEVAELRARVESLEDMCLRFEEAHYGGAREWPKDIQREIAQEARSARAAREAGKR